MIRFIDGFSYVTGSWWPITNSKWSCSQDNEGGGSIIGGRQQAKPLGNAVMWQNTVFGSGRASYIGPGPEDTWYVGFNLSVRDAFVVPRRIFLRFENGVDNGDAHHSNPYHAVSQTGCILSVTMEADGRLGFYILGSGTEADLGTVLAFSPSNNRFTVNSWKYVEIKFTGTGGGYLEVHFDDQLVVQTTARLLGKVDRISRYWTNFGTPGIAWGDLYIADAGDSPFGKQDFLGPCQITTHFPASNITQSWQPGSNDAAIVNSTNPGAGFLTGPPGSEDWYQLAQTVPCFGRILAIAANATCAEDSLGSSGAVAVRCRANGRGDATLLGQAAIANGAPHKFFDQRGYTIGFGLREDSLASPGNYWTAGELMSAYWGVTSGAAGYPPGTLRLYQFFVEQLVSLRPVPYSCGQSSYAF